jgi:hypothetical protein
MPAKRRRLIFELSSIEKESKPNAALSEDIKKATVLNQPMVYRNELYVKPNLFVHKYPSGRSILIEQDPNNSVERIAKVLR